MIILDKLHRLMRRTLVLRGARMRTREIGGHLLHWYELDGKPGAPAAVFVHGLGGTANSFFNVLPALRAHYSRLYVPDLPGHGFSPLGQGATPLDIRGHFEVLKQFLDEIVGGPCVMVGNSMGGALSLETAIERPEQTLGVGLLSPAGAPLGEAGISDLRRAFTISDRKDATKLVLRMLHKPIPGHWLVARDLAETFDTPIVHHVLNATDAAESLDPEKLGALPMPVTFVWGGSERLLPGHGLDFFRTHLPPHARVAVLENCGHVPMLDQPARTVRLLADLAKEAHTYGERLAARRVSA